MRIPRLRTLIAAASWLAFAALLGHRSNYPWLFGRYSVEYSVILAVALLGCVGLSVFAARAPATQRSALGALLAGLPLLLLSTVLSLLAAEALVRVTNLFGVSLYEDVTQYVLDLEADPLTVYRHRANFSTAYNDVPFTTNALGFRQPGMKDKSADSTRVMVLGDSVSLAWGVPMQDGFSQRLEAPLAAALGHGVETINTGVSGYNTRQEFGVLTKHFEAVAPDRILLVYVGNDIEPAARDIVEMRSRWQHPSGANQYLLRWSWLYRIVFLFAPHVLFSEQAPVDAEGRRDSLEQLTNISRYAREHQVPLAVCLFRMSASPLSDDLWRDLQASAAANGFPVCDMLPWFAGRNIRTLTNSLIDTHPNAAGHQTIADGLAQFLGPLWKAR